VTNISVSVDDELIEWLDQLIKLGVIKSRSEAVREALFDYVKHQLGITDRKGLREFIRDRQKMQFQAGEEVIRQVREES